MTEQWKQNIKSQWQTYTKKAQEWWSRLSLQEKRTVSIGGSLVTLFLLYALIWSPALDAVAKTRKRIKSDEHTLSWMREADIKIKALENQQASAAQAVTPVDLMSILQKQINQNTLGQSLKEMKQAGSDTVQLSFKQVSFDKVVSFLIATMKQYRFSVEQMSAIAGVQPGIVDMELMLKL